MDIDHIDGRDCLIFQKGERTLLMLREMRNRELMNKLMTDRSGIGIRRTEAQGFGLSSPTTLTVLESFGVVDWSIVNKHLDSAKWEPVTSMTITAHGDRVLRAEDECPPNSEIIVFRDGVEVR